MSWQCQRCGRSFENDVNYIYFNNNRSMKYCRSCANTKATVDAELERAEAERKIAQAEEEKAAAIRKQTAEMKRIEEERIAREENSKLEEYIDKTTKEYLPKYVEEIGALYEEYRPKYEALIAKWKAREDFTIDTAARKKWLENPDISEKIYCPLCKKLYDYDKIYMARSYCDWKPLSVNEFLEYKFYKKNIIEELKNEINVTISNDYEKFRVIVNAGTAQTWSLGEYRKRIGRFDFASYKESRKENLERELKKYEKQLSVTDPFLIYAKYKLDKSCYKYENIKELPKYGYNYKAPKICKSVNKETKNPFKATKNKLKRVVDPNKIEKLVNSSITESYIECCPECKEKYLQEHSKKENEKQLEAVKAEVREKYKIDAHKLLKKEIAVGYMYLIGIIMFFALVLVALLAIFIGVGTVYLNNTWKNYSITADSDSNDATIGKVLGVNEYLKTEDINRVYVVADEKLPAAKNLISKTKLSNKEETPERELTSEPYYLKRFDKYKNFEEDGTTCFMVINYTTKNDPEPFIDLIEISTDAEGKVTSYKCTRQKFSKSYFWIKDE